MSNLDLDRAFAEFASTGSPERLGEVYDALAPELLRVAIHMTRGAAEAEDVLQATFVTAIERAGSFEKGRPVRPWLTGILAHHARASRRRTQRVPDPERTRTPEEMSPVDHAEQRELFETLDRVLLDLPEAFRPVLVLRLKHGLTAPEIAEALARPPGTVRSQLARGLEEVRRAMPAGLAGAFVLLAAQPVRGLDSIRETILSTAAQHAPVAAALTPIAGAIILKKLALVAAVLVVTWIGWRTVRADPQDSASSLSRTDAPAVASANHDGVRQHVEPVLESTSRDARAPVESTPVSATSSQARLEITAVYARDGRPARGEVVLARFDGEHLPYFDEHFAMTDVDGRVVFDPVPPGPLVVRMLQGGTARGIAAAGETLALQLAQPAGLLVEGEVVDADGNAVRDASIWSSDRSNPAVGEVVAKADAAGRFRLPDVGRDRYVAAFSPGRALSGLHALSGEPGDVVHVTIVVDKIGAELGGRVLDEHGLPVARARVMAGDEVVHFDQPAADGMRMPGGAPVHTVTDAEGRYRLSGVPLGRVLVQARAPCFATTKGEVVVAVSRTVHDIVLAPESIVMGTVRDAEGAPVSGVEIRCGNYAEFATSRAWSDSSGKFVLGGLRAGRGDLVTERREQPRLQISLDLVAGETRTWDPRFDAGADPGWGHVRGTLRDEHGAPIVVWPVGAVREDATTQPAILGWSDASGKFILRVETGVRYRLVVHAPDEWAQFPRATRSGIVAGDADIEIVIGADEPDLAIVRGTVVTSSGDPAVDAQVIAWHAGERVWLKIPVEHGSGNFEIARMPPGKVDFEVRSMTLPWVVVGSRTIEAGARIDLGTIRMPAGGRVTGKIVGARDESLTDVEISISESSHKQVGLAIRHGRAWSSNALAAGTYTLYAHGSHVTDTQRDFEITPGRDTDFELAVREAEARPVRVDGLPTGPEAWVTVVVIGADGKQTCMRSTRAGADGVARMAVAVEPGAWKLLAMAANGRRAEVAFTHVLGDSDEIAMRLPD